MLRWLADENFNNDILRALLREKTDLDIVRAQDVGLTGSPDEALLAWAADQNRVNPPLLYGHPVADPRACPARPHAPGLRPYLTIESLRRDPASHPYPWHTEVRD